MIVEVVTSGISGCSSCEKAKELVKKILKDFSNVDFREIDALEQPERIQELGFVNTSAIVINGNVEFSSVPKEKVLRLRIEEIRNKKLGTEA
ncbi:thioredoxin family protein [Paenisporosarcina sp. TG20]|uniref:glutaredoxin family protein n=1 Tax=Paenisporosarcina sp. TG20 TaxID=1211706 RepID=UPI0002F0AFF4|nr:thioredoxin family protein [Paenisporosarcina sp. TG20]